MKKTNTASRKSIHNKSREEGIPLRNSRYCIYCGQTIYPVHHPGYRRHNLCKKGLNPIYFNESEMGALIGMCALGFRLGLIGGDGAWDIATKLQLWCKKYGFPRWSIFGMKIDETTFDQDAYHWLRNLRESSSEKKEFWSSMVAKDRKDRLDSMKK
ncbi:MAG TPA: hypothetical protein VLA53_02085 [Nitrosopumilaceae archaeon]|nr:hypothetical protein [Nitrosopumilaceae archaeon]